MVWLQIIRSFKQFLFKNWRLFIVLIKIFLLIQIAHFLANNYLRSSFLDLIWQNILQILFIEGTWIKRHIKYCIIINFLDRIKIINRILKFYVVILLEIKLELLLLIILILVISKSCKAQFFFLLKRRLFIILLVAFWFRWRKKIFLIFLVLFFDFIIVSL